MSKSFETLREAKRWRDQVRGDVARRKRVAVPNQRLHDVAQAWLADLDAGRIRSARGGHEPLSPETAYRYRSQLERLVLPALGGYRVGALERRHVQAWLDDLASKGRSAADRKNALKPLAAIYRRLVENDELVVSPTRGVRIERARTRQDRIEDPDDVEQRVVTPLEAAALLGVLPPHARAVFAVAFYAGLRVGELRALEWVSVRGGEVAVDWQWPRRLPKGGRRRRVPLLAPLAVELEGWQRESGRRDGLVLGSTGRDPFTPRWIQLQADRAWREAGLVRVTPHLARHVFESTLAAAGVPEDDILRWMGQTSRSVRQLYTHEIAGAQARAVERVQAFLGHE